MQPERGSFTDVKPNHWAYPYLEAGVRAGLWKGYPDGSFRPDSLLTRAEAAALLVRFAGVQPTATVPLADVSAGNWACDSAAEALVAGLLPPTASGFSPQAAAGRLEVVRGLALAYTLMPSRSTALFSPRLNLLEGEVWVANAAGQRQPAGAAALEPGSTVQTGPNGRAEIIFEDGSAILLEPRTVLRLDRAEGYRFIDASGRERLGIEALELTLDRGTIFGALAANNPQESGSSTATTGSRFATGPAPSPSAAVRLASAGSPLAALRSLAATQQNSEVPWYLRAYTRKARVKINMPWGVAGIRGTFWKIRVEDTGFSASVLVGEAEVTAAGQTVSLRSGQYTEAPTGRAPAEPKDMPVEEKRAWAEKQAWVEEVSRNIEANRPPIPPAEARELAGALLAAPPPGAPPEAIPVPPPAGAVEQPATGVAKPAAEALTELVRSLPAGPVESTPTEPAESFPADTVGPVVVARSPEPGAMNVPVNVKASISFNEPLDPKSVSQDTVKLFTGGSEVPGAVDYDAQRYVVIFTPKQELNYATAYTVILTAGIRDLAGNPLPQPVEWSFTTAAPPEVAGLGAEWLAETQVLRVSWDEVTGADGYLASWKPAAQLSFGEPQTVTGQTYCEITGLEEDRAYTVRVQVYANGSTSAGKTLLAVTGRPALPSPLPPGSAVTLLELPSGTWPSGLGVSGRWAVWQQVYSAESTSVTLAVYDLEYGHTFTVASYISSGEGKLAAPAISGDYLAWAEPDGPSAETASIKVLDLESGKLTQVLSANGVTRISLTGGHVAWLDNSGSVRWQSLVRDESGAAQVPLQPYSPAALAYPWLVYVRHDETGDGVTATVYALNFADTGATPLPLWSATWRLTDGGSPGPIDVALTSSADAFWAGWSVAEYAYETVVSSVYLARLGVDSQEPAPVHQGDAGLVLLAAGGGKFAWLTLGKDGYSLYLYDPVTDGLGGLILGSATQAISELATNGNAVLWWESGENSIVLKAYRPSGGSVTRFAG